MRSLAPSTGTAHRPTRENRKSKEQQDLRRENHHLAREVARLRKQLVKATDVKQAFESEDAVKQPSPVPDAAPGVEMCPKCPREEGVTSAMRAVELPFGVLHVCPICKHRFVKRAAA